MALKRLELLAQQWPDALSGHSHLELGLSGGLDSMVLLSLLSQLRQHRSGWTLSAVHVHHGLSPNADAWVEHCRLVCQQLAIPLRVVRVQLTPRSGASLEAIAREARYQVYAQSDASVLALAHHQDDQAETVLLQLLRGGGVKALAAMPMLRPLGDKLLWRPLLGIPRSELEDYAKAHQLRWVEDESNQQTQWRRNWLRHEILPAIAQHLPHYRQHLIRAAALQADAASVLEEVSQSDLLHCQQADGLDYSRWLMLSPARQRHVLLAWLRRLNWSLPEPAALQNWQQQLQAGSVCPQLSLHQGLLYRFRERIQALPALEQPSPCALGMVDPQQSQALPPWGGCLSWQWRAGGLATEQLAELQCRPRQGGERLSVKVGHKLVKHYLQEAAIAPPLRARWPLLYNMQGELLAIPSVAVSVKASAAMGWWPLWQVNFAESI